MVFISVVSGFDEGICEIICVVMRFMELGHIILSIRPNSLHFSFSFLFRTIGFQLAWKVVYTAIWVAVVPLFMELLGFST